ncbi:MAG: DUF1641 domain-containing protein [Thermoplasmataceae archaeon]
MAKMIEKIEENGKTGIISPDEVLEQIAGHAQDISAVLELIAAANKTGMISFLKSLVENYQGITDVVVEEATSQSNMRFLRNLLSIYTVLSRVDPDRLRPFMENAAHSVEDADRLKAEGPLGLLKIGSQLKDPDVSAGVRVLLSMAKGFTEGRKNK